MILSCEERKNIFKNGLKNLPPLVVPTVQNLSFCQVPGKKNKKNAATQKLCREYFKVSKMTVGTGSWRPGAENTIPCVEIVL